MVYGTYNYSIHGVYKPTNITGGPHLVLYFSVRWSMNSFELPLGSLRVPGLVNELT